MDHRIEDGRYFTKKEARRRFRQEILDAWDNRCAYCDCELGKLATLDHVHPKVKGGQTHKGNMIPACLTCNISKSASDWIDWFRDQAFWEPHREDAVARWIAQRAY